MEDTEHYTEKIISWNVYCENIWLACMILPGNVGIFSSRCFIVQTFKTRLGKAIEKQVQWIIVQKMDEIAIGTDELIPCALLNIKYFIAMILTYPIILCNLFVCSSDITKWDK